MCDGNYLNGGIDFTYEPPGRNETAFLIPGSRAINVQFRFWVDTNPHFLPLNEHRTETWNVDAVRNTREPFGYRIHRVCV